MDARRKVVAARVALVLEEPFFGTLALRLALHEDPTCATAWVDGRSLGYNPNFVERLTHHQLIALIAHEVMHVACGHPWRRDRRERRRWNEACDHAINPVLQQSGFTLPEDWLLDAAYAGKSAEWIFDRLPEPRDGDQNGHEAGGEESAQGQGQGQDSGQADGDGGPSQGSDGRCRGDPPGEVRDAPADTDADGTSEADWQQAVQQAAAAAKARGDLPGELERFAKDAAKPRVDWRSVLRRFVQQVARADYSWTRPSTRYLARGLYLPALRSQRLGAIVVAVDTSGSIDQVLLDQFAAELRGVVDEAQPARVHVMYCDAAVRRTDTFERDDVIDLHPVGGGGTDFRPVFDALDRLEEPPACLIYMTDGCGRFPLTAPDFPVLWAMTSNVVPPFGETVEIAS